MSAGDEVNYRDIIKNHVRLRLMESKWDNKVSNLITNEIRKRIKAGQDPKTIKFEELYENIRVKARDAISIRTEQECHTKIKEYLSLERNAISGSASVSSDVPNPSTSSSSTDVATKNMDDIIKLLTL